MAVVRLEERINTAWMSTFVASTLNVSMWSAAGAFCDRSAPRSGLRPHGRMSTIERHQWCASGAPGDRRASQWIERARPGWASVASPLKVTTCPAIGARGDRCTSGSV